MATAGKVAGGQGAAGKGAAGKGAAGKAAAGKGAAGKGGTPGAAGAEAPRARSFLWLQGLVCGAVATLATPTALLAGGLLLPAILAMVLETTPGRPLTRVLALFGAAAAVQPLSTLWHSGHTLPGALNLLEDPATLSLSYAAAGIGWLLVHLLPVLVRAALEGGAVARAARLRAARARLAEEWRLD